VLILLLTIPVLATAFVDSYTFLSKLSFVSIMAVLVGILSMSGVSIATMVNDEGCDPSLPSEGSCEIVYFDIKAIVGHVGAATIAFEGANGLVVNVRSECKNIH
jgi:hypothetical protein